MKNFKGLILCSGGYSSSIISNRLNELGEQFNIKFDEGGYGMESIESLGEKYNIILIAPHLSMYYEDFEDVLQEMGVALLQIQSSEYVAVNAEKLFDRVIKLLDLNA